MPHYSIILIGSLVLVAGVIAYTGNWVGRRLGKQRRSLFGLRPRYTATLFTILVGMLISGLTIVVLASLSKEVQIALTQVGALLQDQKSLKAENLRLRNTQLELAQSLHRVRVLKAKSDSELRKAQKDAATAERRYHELGRQISAKELALRNTTIRLTVAQKELTQSSVKLALVNTDLAKARKQLDSAGKLAVQVGKDNLKLFATKYLYETRKIIYRPDQEISRGVVHGNQTPLQIRNDLIALLARAGGTAREHGAVGVPKAAMAILPSGILGGKDHSQEQLLADVSKWMSRAGTDQVVRIMALFNTVQGQPVTAFLVMSPNKIVYLREHEIASIEMDSHTSESALLDQLISALKTKVRSEAVERGIIPRPDPDSGDQVGSIGEISGGELLQVVQQVKKQGGLTRVRFLAGEDTWAEGPLHIQFQVTEERSAGSL